MRVRVALEARGAEVHQLDLGVMDVASAPKGPDLRPRGRNLGQSNIGRFETGLLKDKAIGVNIIQHIKFDMSEIKSPVREDCIHLHIPDSISYW